MENKKLEKMFPYGYYPEGILDEEEFASYDEVRTTLVKTARNMVIQQLEYRWTADGDFSINEIYNVFTYPCPDGIPLLSAYGAKMRHDWKQREQFKHLVKKEEIDNAGYHYTGL